MEYWWDELEGDFARYLGVDARDFIRGTRPWSQFLTYATYVGQIDGGVLWAAQLNDDRFLPEIEKSIKETKGKPPARPSLTGYSREVDGLLQVATELRLLRAEMGKWTSAPPVLRPVFPYERIQARLDEVNISELQEAIEVGHRNWREANDRIQRG